MPNQLTRRESIAIPAEQYRYQDQPPKPRENITGAQTRDTGLEADLEFGLDGRHVA